MPHGVEYVAISHNTGTLEDQRAMYAPVGTNDEAHFDPFLTLEGVKKRIGRRQCDRSLNLLTRAAPGNVRHVLELRRAYERAGKLPLAMLEIN